MYDASTPQQCATNDFHRYSDKDFILYIDADAQVLDALSKQAAEDALRQDMFLLGFCTDGNCQISVGENTYNSFANHVLVLTPGTSAHFLAFSPDVKVRILAVSIDFFKENLQGILPYTVPIRAFRKNETLVGLDTSAFAQLHDFFDFLAARSEELHKPYGKLVLRHVLIALALWIYDTIPTTSQEPYDRSTQVVETLLLNISKYYRKNRRVQFYADLQCLTPKYLSAVSQRVSQKNVSQWINEFVLSEAKSLLRTYTYTIQQIAQELMFPDQSTFTKFFRKHVGMSPKDFRIQAYEDIKQQNIQP